VKSFLETVEKYNINDIVALAHRTAAAYPLDTINLHIFNTRYKSENARSENQLILDFFKQHNLLPNNVYSIELVGPKDELGQDFCSAVSVEPFVGKLAPLKMFAPEVKLTTAAEWQEHKKIPAADILFGASLTNEYLPAEIKFPVPPPAVQQLTKPVATVTPIATVAQVTPAVASVQTAVPSSTRSTITFAQMTAQRVGLLDGYKSGEISIARYMSANNLKTDTHVFSNKNILDMLIAISKWDKWVEKGKGNANPLMFGKPHTPDSIRKMRNGVYNDLVTLRKEIQAKLDDTFGTFRRSRTTQAFYELIAAMPKFENNDVRDMGIRAFCLRYDIDYETIAKQADAPILDGVEADAMNAVYRKT
jgi:hypothetical protein